MCANGTIVINMSKTLMKVSDFLKYLLSASLKQGKQLLLSVNSVQLKAISEIAYNLLLIDLPKALKSKVKKLGPVLKKLSKKTIRVSEKLKILAKNITKLLVCFQLAKQIILDNIR